MLSAYLKERLTGALPKDSSLWLWDEKGDRIVGVGPHSPSQAPEEEGPETQEHWWTYSMPVEFAETSLGWLTLISSQPTPVVFLKPLAMQLGALIHLPKPELAAPLDRAIGELHRSAEKFQWTGLYYKKGEQLELACFRGEPTPHAIIPVASGLCGAAVRENQTINIGDVGQDPRYLSCDMRTRSELIVPIRDPSGEAIGEIDIDSWEGGEFAPELVSDVEQVAKTLAAPVLELGKLS